MKRENGRGHFWQWELNQRLIITWNCTMVQFANGTLTNALGVAVVEENGTKYAEVPNILLQTAADLHTYAWDEEKACVLGHSVFAVEPMPKPAQYPYTQTEIKRYDLLLSALEEKGAYYVPSVDDEGNLTWSKTMEQMPDVPKANIRGPKGERGADGEQGPQGEKGDPGESDIDDTKVSATAPWSSKNTVDRLCPSFTESGASVTCQPVEGYPLSVVSKIEPVQEGEGDPRPASLGDGVELNDVGPYDEFNIYVIPSALEPLTTYKLAINTSIVPTGVYITDSEGNDLADVASVSSIEFTTKDSGEITINVGWENEALSDALDSSSYVLCPYDPGNLRPITGHSAVKLWRSGRNLFDFKQDATLITYYTVAGAERQKYGFIVPLAAGTYTFSIFDNKVIDIATTTRYVWLYIINSEKWISSTLDKPLNGASFIGNITFDMPENCSLLVINGGSAGANTVFTEEFNYQLEVGSAPTAYEPYRGGEFTFDLGQTVYGGSLNWATGALTLDRKLKTFTGSEKWSYYSNSSNVTSCFSQSISDKAIGYKTSICNRFKNTNNSEAFSSTLMEHGLYADHATLNNVYFDWGEPAKTTETRATALKNFKAWLKAQYDAGTPVQLCYQLAEPITVQLTPREILALSGTNTLYSDTGDTTVSGRADPTAVIEKLTNAIIALGGNV